MEESTQRTALETFYHGWGNYQDLLVKALVPLTPEQLELRAASDLRSIGIIAAHIVGARARWMHQALREGGDEVAALASWGRPDEPVPTGAELAAGLQVTWRCIRVALDRWTPAELAETLHVERRGEQITLTRQWVIWHLIEHDLHHGGELSFSLGMHGLAAPDL